jgi:hypothetical protein
MKETIAFGVELSAFVVDATVDLDDDAPKAGPLREWRSDASFGRGA